MVKEEALKRINELYEINKLVRNIDEHDERLLSNKFRKVLLDIGLKSSDEISRKTISYFVSMFLNITSNSMLLWEDKNGSYNFKETIVTGKYGFGIRANKQAKPVNNIDDLKVLKKHLPEILTALNNRKKWNKADELQKFFDIINLEDSRRIIFTTKLKHPIELPSKEMDRMKIYDTINIQIQDNNAIYMHLSSSKESTEGIRIVNSIGSYDDEIFTSMSLLINFALSDQVDFIKESLHKYVENVAKERNLILDELNTNFGKYIMAQNL